MPKQCKKLFLNSDSLIISGMLKVSGILPLEFSSKQKSDEALF